MGDMLHCVIQKSHLLRTATANVRSMEQRRKVRLEGTKHLKSELKPRRRYSAPVKTQLPPSGFRGFSPSGA